MAAPLADDMGLGKTVQAIVAADILRQTRRIERVLVVVPVSLKTEWEEQIRKFSQLSCQIVMGPRAVRLRQYREPSFFNLVNYEQVVVDHSDIVRILAPDLVILDEAQRIKNWQTKTAQAVKQLSSPYAFVLTGTPLENRIDEVYSIAQFLDQELLGPLFRFNRRFHILDDSGKPVGYKNLDELHRTLRTIMLRRLKADVEDQLPPRTVVNRLVEMTEEQRSRYAEIEAKVARLVSQARRRPLRKEEFERLQQWLACMRMLCDTTYILDQEHRDCPKLPELDAVLESVLTNETSKVIVFSEWERMLTLVRELLEEKGILFAWHTGSVPQNARRAEIQRFKTDPECRVFLSTDSGATGLNLQAADTVINLDLPWNPAKLEQRIARAWRKHQTRSVRVVNLITGNSIEERMLDTLVLKRQVAEEVLDGRGDQPTIHLPSGRAALVERLERVLGLPTDEGTETRSGARATAAGIPGSGGPAPKIDLTEAFAQDVKARLGERLLIFQHRRDDDGLLRFLMVIDGSVPEVQSWAVALLQRLVGAGKPVPTLDVLDRSTHEIIQRLAAGGFLQQTGAASEPQGDATEPVGPTREQALSQRRKAVFPRKAGIDRARKLATVMGGGGFPAEAMEPLAQAMNSLLWAACHVSSGMDEQKDAVDMDILVKTLEPEGLFPPRTRDVVLAVRSLLPVPGADREEEKCAELLLRSSEILDGLAQFVFASA